MISIVPNLEYDYLIGFRSAEDTREITDRYFEYFSYTNRAKIVEQGTSFFITVDADGTKTKVMKVYTNKDNHIHIFDQYIIADDACGVYAKIRQEYLTRNIRWSDRIPEEFRIQYCDVGADLIK